MTIKKSSRTTKQKPRITKRITKTVAKGVSKSISTPLVKPASSSSTSPSSSTSLVTSSSSISLSSISPSANLPVVGSVAPDFSLPDMNGKIVNLSKLRGKKIVVYFYPKDDTPGCTLEAKGFRDDATAYKKKGVLVYGISKDDEKSHRTFAAKYGLNFPILSDTTAKTIKAYGVWVERSMYGRKFMGIQRSTFLIDEKGKIAQVWPKVTPEGHSKEILKII